MICAGHGKYFILAVVLTLFSQRGFAGDYTLGYGLVFSANELRADEIGEDFSRIGPGGHSSYFFVEKNIADDFTLLMSPGAMNFEDGEAQFHVQYNVLSANYKMDARLFPVIGAGLGGCIATLTEADGDFGEIQTGAFIRNSTFLWMARAGFGFHFTNRIELIFEGRAFGFLDGKFRNMNSLNAGFSLGYTPE